MRIRLMASCNPKHLYRLLAVVTTLVACAVPAFAYYFQGYYCPAILISPMREDLTYTPVGLGVVTSNAGFRVHPITGKHAFHSGVDLAAHLNDKVYCLLDGIVTRVGQRGGLGVAVEVYHPYPNVSTIIGHLNAYAVLPGMYVQRGRVIGYAGSTGMSTGVHVHYTVINHATNEYIEPMQFIKLVPKYLAALRTARTQLAAAHNMEIMKKKVEGAQPTDTETEDLPDDSKKKKKD